MYLLFRLIFTAFRFPAQLPRTSPMHVSDDLGIYLNSKGTLPKFVTLQEYLNFCAEFIYL
jgi:hypothetical protein